ncbi:MAG TPA: protein kinase [Terracidiphilus sp.]|jgi:serine/threonine protein kinase/predicted Zn-dependent protease
MDGSQKRPASDKPTQPGTTAAVSSSADNLRPGDTLVPPSRSEEAPEMTEYSDQTMVPPSRSDKTIVPGGAQTRASARTQVTGGRPDSEPDLHPGTILANRYEILSVLGTGGMGSVYKAKDLELDRLVALKVIRPELARNQAIVDRFKQELRLSHKVTHRNVVRLYDLSEDAGMRFVTMELVPGRDLRSLLEERGKLPANEAVEIFQQICTALEAAHVVGILHRDLKPQNIMLEDTGRVVVMDFGLARMIDSDDGMTQTGALVGTLDYMSPEQALGKELDQRSDIFALGLIGYEMMTGSMPFRAESMVASLLKRTQQRAVPLSEVDKNIPGTLSNIIAKCLEKDPANRYQRAGELEADLRSWKATGKVSASSMRLKMLRLRELPWQRLAIAGVLIVAIAAGASWFIISRQRAAAPVPHGPISVLVGDFANHTGDPLLDNSLEQMLGVALEGASFINAYSRGDARKQAEKLPNPTDKLDEQSARLIAVNQDVNTVITGDINLRGDAYDISAVALDAVSGKEIARSEITVSNKQDILKNLPQLAAPIRKALGDSTPTSVQFAEVSGGFKAASLEAVHQASIGVDEQLEGKFQEAFDSFQKAATLDPKLTWAYTGMAAMAVNMGKPEDSLKYMQQAMQYVDNMTEREKYRDRGLYYRIAGDWQNCVQEYTQLVTKYPADRVGQNNLSICYTQLRNAPKALEAARRAVEIMPKAVSSRLNLGFISAFAGDFAGSEKEARTALSINPKAAQAYLVLAEAQMGLGQVDNASQSYHQLEAFGPAAASTAADGLADLAAYQDRHADAEKILKEGAAADLAAKNNDSAARKDVALANVEQLQGKHAVAIADADKALALSQTVPIQMLAALTYIDAGEIAKAQKQATALSSALPTESQAYGKILAGLIALKKKDTNEAIRQIFAANNMLDTWIGRYELGRTYLEAGAFTQADAEFDRCLKRRGEAIELFDDNVPTYAYFPPIYYYEGRAREGMKTAGFADFYRSYLAIRGQSMDDPLVVDTRRRLGN